MDEKTLSDLTHDLFRMMKQFPRLKMYRASIDGMARSEYELLVFLALNLGEDKKTFSVTEISNLLQITPAGVTHLINPLEETGHIVRLPGPNDRRIVLVGLTDKGSAAAETILLDFQDTLTGLFNYLGEEDSQTFVRVMSQIIKYLAS